MLPSALPLPHAHPRRSVARLLALAFGLTVGVAMAGPLAADPLDLVLASAGTGGGEILLDEQSLAGIRGRGAESPDIAAPEVGDVAVVLWDELKRPGQQGQPGAGLSQSSGHNNAQASTLTLTRY